LRIALVSSTYPPDATGGRAQFAKELAEELIRQKHDVTVLTGLWSKDLGLPNVVQFKIPKHRGLWYPVWAYKLRRYLKKNKFDVIHTNGSREGSVLASTKEEYITSEHDIGAFQMQMRLVSSLIKKNVKRAKLVIVGSPSVQTEFETLFPEYADKIRCVPYGINTHIFNMSQRGTQLKKKLAPEGLVGLYLGRIAKYKGVENIINTFLEVKKKIPTFTPLIVGGPTLAMKQQYAKWVEKYPQIKFTGYIPNEELPQYYSAADFFVTFSSAGEGFGFTLGEAMACGTPVIAPELPAYKFLIGDAGLLVPIKDEASLTKAVFQMVQNDRLRSDLAKKGHDRIHSTFSWEVTAKQMVKLYEES
jgi:glycosyltransferase involved in cell wall biosynthesis